MTWLLIAAGVVVLLFVVRRVIAGLSYGKLFAPAHLAELARKVVGSRASALAHVVAPGAPEEEPAKAVERGAAFVTSLGVGWMYSVVEKDDGFEHHVSMSLRTGATRSLAVTLFAFARRVLGLADVTFAAEDAGTHATHFVARLSAEEHAAHAAESPAAPDEAACAGLFAEVVRSGERGALLASLSAGDKAH